LIGWTATWAALVLVLVLVSDGEPICEGPLILGADDSDPPQCDGPLTGLATVGPILFVIGLVIFSGLALVIELLVRRSRRSRS
jgi:hypothetical protein